MSGCYLFSNGTALFADAIFSIDEKAAKKFTESYKNVKSDVPHSELVFDEANAYFAETVFANKNVLESITEKMPSLKERILSFFEGAQEEYKGVPKFEGAAKRYYKLYKKMFDEFAARNEGNNAEGASAEGVRYAMGGVNAATADKMKLATAEKMLESGTDAEAVRKETGWYKGYDGKWRFEIDDSEMSVDTRGLYSNNPDIRRYTELTDKVYFGDGGTQAEQAELSALSDNLDGVQLTPKTIGEIIKSDALFAAYPQLKDIRVTFASTLPENARGAYNPEFNEITISQQVRMNKKVLKEVLIHEVQHAVQEIEGFARGASTDYYTVHPEAAIKQSDKKLISEAKERFDKVRQKFISEWGEDNMNLKLVERYEELWDMESSGEQVDSAAIWKEIEEIEDIVEDSDWNDLFTEYTSAHAEYEMAKERAKLRRFDKFTAYKNTAGEIEARDVASRVDMTAEQRKNTRPDIDRTDVVFAEDGASWMAAKNAKYDPETSSIAEQIRHYQDELNKMDVVGSAKAPTKFSSKADAANWAIKELNPTGYQVDRQNFGKIYFSENDIKYGVNYADTDAEKAALVLLPKVLKRGIVIEEHSNHKGRSVNNPKGLSKRTITIAAPVELNGIRGNMGVVINGNGNHYYTHRILLPNGKSFTFSEAKAEARQESYRVGDNINPRSDTTSLASDKSISQSGQNVNTEAQNSSDIRFALPMDDGRRLNLIFCKIFIFIDFLLYIW